MNTSGGLGYRQRQHPHAPAEGAGPVWAFKHLGSEQRGLCKRRAKSCTGRRRGSEEPRERAWEWAASRCSNARVYRIRQFGTRTI
jgi:hypothetical protein